MIVNKVLREAVKSPSLEIFKLSWTHSPKQPAVADLFWAEVPTSYDTSTVLELEPQLHPMVA